MTSKLTSKEIRAMNFNATWKQFFDLLQEIAARMAEQAERTSAPEAASAHVSEVRSNPGNENGAWCEICCATLVCPSCGNHRSEPAAPPSDAVTRDVVTDAIEAWLNCRGGYRKSMTAALRTFARSYQVTRFRIEQSLPLHVQRHDPEYSVRVHDLTMHALLPEVPRV